MYKLLQSGQGYTYSNENGKFEVRTKEIKQFTRLSVAKKYYESLNEDKAMWDLTHIPELLDAQYVKDIG